MIPTPQEQIEIHLDAIEKFGCIKKERWEELLFHLEGIQRATIEKRKGEKNERTA